jgi:hypothetical protein
MMEGVSPYIEQHCFARLLKFIAVKLRAGSQIAYDFKIRGLADDLGSSGKNKNPFRLPAAKGDIVAYHEAIGYNLENMEMSHELSSRVMNVLGMRCVNLFTEDCLLRLTLA